MLRFTPSAACSRGVMASYHRGSANMLKWGVRVLLALALGAALQTAAFVLAACAALGLLLTACSYRTSPRSGQTAPRATTAALMAAAPLVAAHAALPSLTVISHSSSAQTNVPVTFGQTFKPGDIPSGSTVSATTASGTAITLQVDPKATNADGSLRHAVLTA